MPPSRLRLAREERSPAPLDISVEPDRRHGPKLEFRYLSVDELLNQKAPPPLVDGLFFQRSTIILFAKPGNAKTFLALDMALSIASGERCLGRATHRGPVLYVAAEGQEGIKDRVRAWQRVHPAASLRDFKIYPESVNLLDNTIVEAHVEQIQSTWDPLPALVVFDTLARCIPGGDENSSQDMGIAVRSMDAFKSGCESAVMALHHTGKKTDIERGSGSLRGGVDTMAFIEDVAEAEYVLHCEKQKNHREFAPVHFKREVVELGEIDESCVIQHTPPRLSTNRRLVLEALAAIKTGLPLAELEAKVHAHKKGLARRTITRALVHLCEGGYVSRPEHERTGEPYLVTPAGVDFLARSDGGSQVGHREK